MLYYKISFKTRQSFTHCLRKYPVKVFFHTFGCKVNSYETEMMAAAISEHGFATVPDQSSADIVVVNSCTVTAGSDRKVRSFIRRVKRGNPDIITILTGCYPQVFPDAADFLDADIVTGNAARASLHHLIFRFLETGTRVVDIPAHTKKELFEHLPLGRIEGHTRAFLKIEDGCDRYCNYCIVPFARGGIRSLPLCDVAAQARRFAEHGYKEVVLTGINLSSYGKESGDTLIDAVNAVAAVDGIVRVRLSSLEPDLMTDRFLSDLAAIDKLCPHFHLSLQSGSDRTLSAMGRRYTASEYNKIGDNIRRLFRDPMFTTDVMVGYPTESDEDFDESLRFIQAFGFLKCHVFPYSPRPGTKAAEFPQLSNKIKNERSAAMIAATDATRKNILHAQIGKPARVILEQKGKDGSLDGHSDNYLPLRVQGENLHSGDVADAEIIGIKGDSCLAKINP